MTESKLCPRCGMPLPTNAPAGLCPKCLMRAGFESGDDSPVHADPNALSPTTPQFGSFAPPELTQLAPYFPQLELLKLLGHGGMGAVYQARQTKLDRLVALKIIRPESTADPAFAERFNREARTLARLNHPSIVAVHDFGEVDFVFAESAGGASRPLYYFIMEYVDRANLRQLIDVHELTPNQALEIVPQVCEALQFAHDMGVIHRDIKPENILVDRRGRVKIADFGLAKLAAGSPEDFTLTATHQVMGTPRYMAPEQMIGSHHVDHRADIYSLGVVFYELLTGEVPMGQFEPPSKLTPLDARLDEVVLRALARDPERRFQSASELKSRVDEISSIASGSQSTSPRIAGPEQRAGVSTIFEREVGAAWRWMAGQPGAAAQRPELPAILLFVLALAGCLMVLLPWIDVVVEKAPQSLGDRPSDWDSGKGEMKQPATGTAEFPVTRTFYGTDNVLGIVASVVFAVLALQVIAIPSGGRRSLALAVLMTLQAGGALVVTLVFPREVMMGGIAVSGQTFNFSATGRTVYRTGFYGSLGFSVALLALSAAGVRHAIAFGGDRRRENESGGAPLARVRFAVPPLRDPATPIESHFASYGYRLLRSGGGEWVFHRGKTLAGLYEFDIRSYDTQLTVRLTDGHAGQSWISCLWEVRTWGALVFPRDINALEQEGRELETLLRSEGVQNREVIGFGSDTPAPTPATPPKVVHDFVTTSTPALPSHSPGASVSDTIRRQVRLPGVALMLYALFLLGPSAALLTSGLEHLSRHPGESAAEGAGLLVLFVIALVFCGMVLRGGWHMLTLENYSAALLGSFFGQPWGLWGLFVLSRPEVKAAFASQPQRSKPEKVSDLPRFSRKAVVGACWAGAFLLLIALIVPAVTVPMTFETADGRQVSTVQAPAPGHVELLLLGLVAIPVSFAPIGTTILGWVALSDIRHSSGKITGLGLAFTDAVLFPMLLLCALIAGAVFPIAAAFSQTWLIALAITLMLCAAIVPFLLRRLWRAVTPPGKAPSAAETRQQYPSSRGGQLSGMIVLAIFVAAYFGFGAFIEHRRKVVEPAVAVPPPRSIAVVRFLAVENPDTPTHYFPHRHLPEKFCVDLTDAVRQTLMQRAEPLFVKSPSGNFLHVVDDDAAAQAGRELNVAAVLRATLHCENNHRAIVPQDLDGTSQVVLRAVLIDVVNGTRLWERVFRDEIPQSVEGITAYHETIAADIAEQIAAKIP